MVHSQIADYQLLSPPKRAFILAGTTTQLYVYDAYEEGNAINQSMSQAQLQLGKSLDVGIAKNFSFDIPQSLQLSLLCVLSRNSTAPYKQLKHCRFVFSRGSSLDGVSRRLINLRRTWSGLSKSRPISLESFSKLLVVHNFAAAIDVVFIGCQSIVKLKQRCYNMQGKDLLQSQRTLLCHCTKVVRSVSQDLPTSNCCLYRHDY